MAVVNANELSRSERKRQAILDAATERFLSTGYAGTNMDQVAAAASVSKQTVYKHFADKETLFVELVTATVEQVSATVEAEVRARTWTGDLQADLTDLAVRLLDAVLQPQLLRVRRLVIGEVGRFPQLGQAFMAQGPGRTMEALAAAFAELAADGALAVDDPAVAAEQFNWLVLGGPLNRAMFLGDDERPADLVAHAEQAVTAFLAAHPPAPRSRSRKGKR